MKFIVLPNDSRAIKLERVMGVDIGHLGSLLDALGKNKKEGEYVGPLDILALLDNPNQRIVIGEGDE